MKNIQIHVLLKMSPFCTTKCAIITNPGAPTRKGEEVEMVEVLKKFYKNIEYIKAPGTCEAGDIMMVQDTLYRTFC